MNFDINKIQLKDLLSELIKTPSVNPDGDPGTNSENTGENKMAVKVGGIFENMGAKVFYDEVEPDRPNVIAKFPGSDNKPQILLAPHLDTVGVGGMTIEPFGGIQKDGKIYGRGASDTKGTMAAMIWALHRIGKEKIKDLGIGVTFVGFMGEETGQPGSHHFAKKYHREYDFAVVGEPTNNNIVCRHKGTLWITLECKGKPAHGSMPERGENAISKMANLVNWLDKDFRRLLKSKAYHNELKTRLFNIGKGYQGLIYREACEQILSYTENKKNVKHIFIGFNALSKSESEVIQEIVNCHGEIYWDIDKSLLNSDYNNASLFIESYLREWPYYKKNNIEIVANEYKKEKSYKTDTDLNGDDWKFSPGENKKVLFISSFATW